MPLTVRYVSRLDEVVDPAIEFLTRDRDLFATPRIVVPTAGSKAWLWSEMARRLGASGGGPGSVGRGDGIVANVEISYPGTILALLQPPADGRPDPWSFDRLTFAVLDVITGPAAAALEIPFDVTTEPLLAARRIAGLFDDYHVRRPGMILEWENEKPNRVMNPTANDEQCRGEPVPDSLPEADRWQFELWRLVRSHVGESSPPARASLAHRGPHTPLLAVGLQSLSWPQLQALQQLGTVCDVEALLVHPSPGLRAAWREIGPQPLAAALLGRPLRRSRKKPGESPGEDDETTLPEEFDQLPAVWLEGARDLQHLIASQAVAVVPGPEPAPREGDTLLLRMQETVATGLVPQPRPHSPAGDHSVMIHRCHSLSRQAEVLHAALLHAFADPRLEGLEPHDVLIVSPCLEEVAPHLEAVFQRTASGHDGQGGRRQVRLPLVVADRGIREISPGVELLAHLLALPGSRCSVDEVLAVAGHALVREHLGIDDDTEATWLELVDRTHVRWGLDHRHRTQRGLTIADAALRDVHTWKSGLEQMLLGVTLPDEADRPGLGAVVPLTDLDPGDIDPITKLIRVLDVVGDLAALVDRPRPVTAWCDAIETALAALCGENCRQLAEPFAQLRRLRSAAADAAADRAVAFAEVRTLLAEWFDEKAGRQPLRTGAITASSMVPLRGVPFRVVCVIGYDEGVVRTADPAKDDLVARMPLVGDVDPLTDSRRTLLDALLAARDRLVITCKGRDVKTNEAVPLVTPLAELVDFAVRHGVGRERIGRPSDIEIDHPRHHLGQRNFLDGGVVPGVIWSHDPLAAKVAEDMRRRQAPGGAPETATADRGGTDRGGTDGAGTDGAGANAAGAGAATPSASDKPASDKPELDFRVLEHLVRDPLGLHLETTLGMKTWRDDEEPTPATLPLALEDRDVRTMTLALLDALVSDPAGADSWAAAQRRSGRLPLGPHGERQLREITLLAAGLQTGLAEAALDITALASPALGVIDLGHCLLVGQLQGLDERQRQFVVVMAGEIDMNSYGRPLHAAALRLLAARAAGIDVSQATIISRRDQWKPGKKSPTKKEPDRLMESWQPRVIRLADELAETGAARRRLGEIAALAREALAAPRPAFRKVITCQPAVRREEFHKLIAADYYPRTAEAVVYGTSPVFDDVFPPGSDRVTFLDTFRRLLQPTYDNKKAYVLS